ncbi:MAG TPA: imidazole glycerol phosphate synthase subunit HisH [Longimicrobiales bacterium]|nr:imidazole glycerol phosphate synthase subunit HisH [Longimicrobiales bacterium]
MRALVIDYGAGNLHSIRKALEREGARVTVAAPSGGSLARAEAIVLPGVGAFGAAVARLTPALDGLRSALRDGVPCLGVCLGMQLLFDASDEGAGTALGVLPGRVRRLRSARSPHIGWNRVAGSALLDGRDFYFAHGFVAAPDDPRVVDGWSELDGDRFPAAVRSGAIRGVQFHPEKSGAAGLALLRAFVEEAS